LTLCCSSGYNYGRRTAVDRTIFKYGNRLAFHPGYYVREYIEYNGYSTADFAGRAGIPLKKLRALMRGDERISLDAAIKLGRLASTGTEYWLNHQKVYDLLVAESVNDRMNDEDSKLIRTLGYGYFRDNFNLEPLPRKLSEQAEKVREIINVSSLSILLDSGCFSGEMSDENIMRANAMVYLALNATMRTEAPRYDGGKFEKAVKEISERTADYEGFVDSAFSSFRKAGVVLTVLPNIPGSKLRGACKKVGKKVMLMVSNRNITADALSFTLMHEASHILNRDWGISMEDEKGRSETEADRYAENMLLPEEEYRAFFASRRYDRESILSFSQSLGRDPGIVVSRLQKDGVVRYDEKELNALRHKYRVNLDLSMCISPFAIRGVN
jgi:HTH-type transcriptional regulator / antitoxin HigA